MVTCKNPPAGKINIMAELLQTKQARLKELRHKIQELKEIKEDLQSKLHRVPTSSSSETLTVAEQDELQCKLAGYQHMGVTAKVLKKGQVRIRFDTSFKGHLCDTYYLQVEFCKDEVKLARHTIPLFVPLTILLGQYNSREVQFPQMLHEIHGYLLAYVNRKKQMEELSLKYPEYLAENISAVKSYNFIQLTIVLPTIKRSPHLFHLHLQYDNMQSSQPTKIRCSDTGDLSISRSSIKQAFVNNDPTDAIDEIIKQVT